MAEVKTFHLQRNEDVSGMSGTGKVAEGVVFSSGRVVLHWLLDPMAIGIYNNLEEVEKIHGHEGRTVVTYDGE